MPAPKMPEDNRDEELADKAAEERLKERAAEKLASPDEPVEIDVEAAEEELEGKVETAATRESRAERRRNRYREAQERESAANKRAEDAERRYGEMQQMLQQHLRAVAPQQPQAPKEEPLAAELKSLFKEQDLLYRDYNANRERLTAAEHEDFARKGRELQERMLDISTKKTLKEMGIGRAPDEKQVRAAIFKQEMEVKHGDVMGDERKRMYADGVWRQLIAEGRQDDWDTMDECMERTRRKFGMPSKTRRAPSESYKSKLTGAGRGAGASGADKSQVVTMGKEYQIMADEAYRHIKDKNERYKRWAAGPGKRMLEKQSSKAS